MFMSQNNRDTGQMVVMELETELDRFDFRGEEASVVMRVVESLVSTGCD